MKEGYIIKKCPNNDDNETVFWKHGFWIDPPIEEAELFEHKKDAKFVVRKMQTPGIYKIEKVFIVQ